MKKKNVRQENEVWEKINGWAQQDPKLDGLRKSLGSITDELAARDAFDLVDGAWVLSDRAWTDWMFAGEHEKYL